MSQRQKNSPLRVLVIGSGPMANHAHLPMLKRLSDAGDVDLCVVCDIQRDRAVEAKTRYGFREDTSDARGALSRDDIDAVYIFGSAQMHHDYGLLALDQGKHLFVEKPIAPSFAAALQLAGKARERGLVAVGGHNRRFFPSLAAARAEAGRTGWRFIEGIFHKPEFDRSPPYGVHSWLTANGIHALDAIVFMADGLPEYVAAIAESAGSPEPRNFSAIMRWPDGRQAAFLSDNSSGSRREEYVIHGIERTCTVRAARLIIETPGSAREITFNADTEGFAAEHQSFLDAIRRIDDAPHRIEALAPTLFLAELIERGYSGPVALPDATRANVQPASISLIERAAPPTQGKSVLAINPALLQNALPLLAAQHRIVSLDDVRASASPRSDVAAVIIGRGGGPVPNDVLEKLPRLSIVGIAALSLAHYGPEALFARGIRIANASDAYARTVAEFALGLALLGRRRAFLSHEVMRSGGWGIARGSSGVRGTLTRTAKAYKPLVRGTPFEPLLKSAWDATKSGLRIPVAGAKGPYALRSFSGVNVGLIGWSANARAFARLLRPFGVKLKVFTMHASDEELSRASVHKSSLDEALKCEIVSLHRGLTAETRHFLGAAELELLRPGAVLVNVARGGLVDPKALVARLRRGDIFACLDTYDEEPLPRSHPLRRMQNVFLTSHIAGGTEDMHEAAALEIVDKVMRHLRGEEVETISQEHWRTMS